MPTIKTLTDFLNLNPDHQKLALAHEATHLCYGHPSDLMKQILNCHALRETVSEALLVALHKRQSDKGAINE